MTPLSAENIPRHTGLAARHIGVARYHATSNALSIFSVAEIFVVPLVLKFYVVVLCIGVIAPGGKRSLPSYQPLPDSSEFEVEATDPPSTLRRPICHRYLIGRINLGWAR